MPVANATAARDEIYGLLKAAVDASAYATVPVLYPDTVKDAPSDGTSYLKAFADLTTERVASLGPISGRRYRVSGLVQVQIFTPYGDGQATADLISGVVKAAFRGVNSTSDTIAFRNARVVDVGRDGAYLQTNVVAEFEYDEIG